MWEEKCLVVTVTVLVINKHFLHFDPTSGGDWAVPADLTVIAALTKGSLMDEKHLPKSKFATYILNPEHSVICASPGVLTRFRSFSAPCRRAQLEGPATTKSLDFHFPSPHYFPIQQNLKLRT